MGAAAAQAMNEVDELASDQISVRELMRLETAQALQRLRAGPSAFPQGGAPPRAASEAIASAAGEPARLLAIYGVGRKLMAEVRADGQTLLFMRGRPEAVGPGRAHAMRLLDISSQCVEISLHGRRESLCAPSPGAGGRD